MWFWVRRLMGQKPPFFDHYGGSYENAEKVLDALFGFKQLMDEQEKAEGEAKKKKDEGKPLSS